MGDVPHQAGSKEIILFVCLHGSAKSLIAAGHLNRLARSRGLALRGESAGVEPDAGVPPVVVSGLADDGIDVHGYAPRQVTSGLLAGARHVVSFGCDLQPMLHPDRRREEWDDLPLVSDGYAPARDAIVRRLEHLLDMLS